MYIMLTRLVLMKYNNYISRNYGNGKKYVITTLLDVVLKPHLI